MLTKQEFNDAEILRNTPFTKGTIRYGWTPPAFFNMTICLL